MEEYQQQKLSLVPAEQLEVQVEEEEDSELSSLLDYTLADVTDFMTEEEATEYIASILEGGEIEQTALFENVTPYVTDNIKVTNYRPDQAVREASLAQKHMWRPGHGEISYLASNTLEVYLGTP